MATTPEEVEFASSLNKLFMEHAKKNHWTVHKTIHVFLGSAVAAVMAQQLGKEVGKEKLQEFNVNAPENKDVLDGALASTVMTFIGELLMMGQKAGIVEEIRPISDAIRNMKES